MYISTRQSRSFSLLETNSDDSTDEWHSLYTGAITRGAVHKASNVSYSCHNSILQDLGRRVDVTVHSSVVVLSTQRSAWRLCNATKGLWGQLLIGWSDAWMEPPSQSRRAPSSNEPNTVQQCVCTESLSRKRHKGPSLLVGSVNTRSQLKHLQSSE